MKDIYRTSLILFPFKLDLQLVEIDQLLNSHEKDYVWLCRIELLGA